MIRHAVDPNGKVRALLRRPGQSGDPAGVFDTFDVTPLLASVSVPTLVMHACNDGVHPMEEGRKLAAGIPDARFVTLESDNHVLLEHEPARSVLLRTISRFVKTD